jgi:allophanate hydrolase
MTDLRAARVRELAGTATDAVERSLAAIAADDRAGIWISLAATEVVRAAAADVDRRVAAGEHLPLAGRTLAVKDNIDVGGLATTAGCPSFAYEPVRSAPVVAALVEAGAVVMGKTNLDQFATGLVGTRSPYGACPNARWPNVISGGSSSGSAVAVAAGHVDLALGTDTAGSGRVPAAANGIVGLKPTRGRIPTSGVVPACRSLDCVSVFARTVGEAELALDLAVCSPDLGDDPYRRAGALATSIDAGEVRLGVPQPNGLTFDGEEAGPARFDAAVQQLRGLAASTVPVDLEPFLAVARLLYQGAFVAERYEAVGAFLEGERRGVDPTVRDIILRSAPLRAFELFRDQAELARARRVLDPLWERFDVLVVPTVPRLPSPAEVAEAPVAVNSMLGTYMNFVNLLDLAAVTVPVPTAHDAPDRPPTSLTLVGTAWSDARLARLAAELMASAG